MDNKVSKFQYIIYILLVLSLGLNVFLYLQNSQEKQVNSDSNNVDNEEIECEKQVCTYGRYNGGDGMDDYTDEEIESFDTQVYRHIIESKDSNGKSIGYFDSTLRLKEKDNTYILGIGAENSEGFFIKGKYTVADDESGIVLENTYAPGDSAFPSSLSFKFVNSSSSLEYVGDSIPGYTLKKGDRYHFVWAE